MMHMKKTNIIESQFLSSETDCIWNKLWLKSFLV